MKWTRVTLSFIGLIMFAQSASAQTMQTTFASQPVFPNSVNPSTYLYHIEPGGSIEDEILIKNLSDQPQELRLYPVDGPKGSGSEGEPSLSYRVGGLEMTEVGTWLSFGLEDNPLTFKPNETKKFTFIISIPKEVEQKTYHGGIALEQLFLPKDGTVATALRKIEKVEITD